MKVHSEKIDAKLLADLSNLKKIRKGYGKDIDPGYYSSKIRLDHPVLANFPGTIIDARLSKVSVKKYEKTSNTVINAPLTRFIVPLSDNGQYQLTFNDGSETKLKYGIAYAFGPTSYKMQVSDLGSKDFYVLILDCDNG